MRKIFFADLRNPSEVYGKAYLKATDKAPVAWRKQHLR